MDIRTAAIEAKKSGRGITRNEWGERPPLILPTNTTLCSLFVTDKDEVIPRWQPDYEDLIANDWYVYG